MVKLFLRTAVWPISMAFTVSSCAHVQYRTDDKPCVLETPLTPANCSSSALEEYRDPDGVEPDTSYSLGFIEFDDQGLLFEREQMKAVLDAVRDKLALKELLIVVFMHGWKHNAAPENDNIEEFRRLLMGLGRAESRIRGGRSRDVMGIYLGWRGQSIDWPVLKHLTFWDRKNTAHKVGRGSVTEVLARLERIKQLQRNNTTLTIVGHSFGGAAIYDAVSQVLEARFAHTVGAQKTQTGIKGFGDLVVLINPAFEALQFATLSDMSTEYAPYRKSQLPLLAVLTSENDKATKYAFPIGRWFSTLFEKERGTARCNAITGETEEIDEKAANVTAIGHFDPYETHVLRAPRAQAQALKHRMGVQSPNFLKIGAQWRRDRPGSKITFTRSILKRSPKSAGRNPYLVVRVDKKLIEHHNDILDDRVVDFVRQLILISSQTPKQRQEIRALATAIVPAPGATRENNPDACPAP